MLNGTNFLLGNRFLIHFRGLFGKLGCQLEVEDKGATQSLADCVGLIGQLKGCIAEQIKCNEWGE